MPHLSFPNESAEYRSRAQRAARRRDRAAPPARGGRRPAPRAAARRRGARGFLFERIGANQRPEQVKLSELFGDFPSILLYSFMYGPERD